MHEYVNFYINKMITDLDLHKKCDERCVFELKIKETPDSYEECYLCCSFESALKCIDEFYNEYGSKENQLSSYEIVKRKVYDADKDRFDEDFISSCTLNSERVICDVVPQDTSWHHTDCDGLCANCRELCINNIDIHFPDFIKYKDLVKYVNYDKLMKYGISTSKDNDDESCTIIPIDCFAMRYRNFDKAFDFHIHIPYCYVETADVSELSDEKAGIYYQFLDFLKSNFQ